MKKELSQIAIDKLKEMITGYVHSLGLVLGDTIQFLDNYIYVEVHSDAHEMKMRIGYPADVNEDTVVEEYMDHIKYHITKLIVARFMGAATDW